MSTMIGLESGKQEIEIPDMAMMLLQREVTGRRSSIWSLELLQKNKNANGEI
jgi:hypothetical protein